MAHVLSPLLSLLTPLNLLFLSFTVYLVNLIYFELTTGARRRRMIAEKGCEPPYKYPHKGLLGRWLGIDVLREFVRTGREGRMQEASRLRNFTNGIKTLQTRRLLSASLVTIEPENVKSVSMTIVLADSNPWGDVADTTASSTRFSPLIFSLTLWARPGTTPLFPCSAMGSLTPTAQHGNVHAA